MANGLRVDDLPHLVRPGMDRAALERAVSQNFEAVQGGLQVLRDALQQVLDQPSEDLEADFAAPEGITTTFSRRKQKRRVSYHVAVRCTLPEDDEKQDRLLVQMAYVDSTGATYKETDSDGDPVIHRALADVPPDTDDIGKVKAVFKNLEKPRYWYVKFRMRWGSKDGWGEFSDWTTPELPKNEVSQTSSGEVTLTEHKHPSPGVHVWKWEDVDAEDVNVDSYHVYVERKNDDGTYTTVDEGYTRSRKWRYEVPTADRGTRHRIKVYVVDEDGNDSSVATGADEEDSTTLLKEDVEPLATGSIDFGDANLSPDGTYTLPEIPAAGGYSTPALRQTTARSNIGVDNKAIHWSSTTKKGSLLVASVFLKKAGSVPTINTPAGWTLLQAAQNWTDGEQFRHAVFYKENAAAQTETTFTFSAAPDDGSIVAVEYEGIAVASAKDASAGNTGTSSTPDSGTTGSTTQNDELWLGFFGVSDWTVLAPTNGFSFIANDEYARNSIVGKVVSATGTANVSVATRYAVSVGWSGFIGCFKAKYNSTQTVDTPDTDKVAVYAKAQNSVTRLAYKDDGGQEHILTGQAIGARAYKSGGTQTIGSGNTANIACQTESYDTHGFHDGVNDARFTIPTGYAGKYRIRGIADYDATSTHNNRLRLSFRLNGTTVLATVTTVLHAVTGGGTCVPVEWIGSLAEADYVEFRGEAVDEAVDIASGSSVTSMSIEYLGNE